MQPISFRDSLNIWAVMKQKARRKVKSRFYAEFLDKSGMYQRFVFDGENEFASMYGLCTKIRKALIKSGYDKSCPANYLGSGRYFKACDVIKDAIKRGDLKFFKRRYFDIEKSSYSSVPMDYKGSKLPRSMTNQDVVITDISSSFDRVLILTELDEQSVPGWL